MFKKITRIVLTSLIIGVFFALGVKASSMSISKGDTIEEKYFKRCWFKEVVDKVLENPIPVYEEDNYWSWICSRNFSFIPLIFEKQNYYIFKYLQNSKDLILKRKLFYNAVSYCNFEIADYILETTLEIDVSNEIDEIRCRRYLDITYFKEYHQHIRKAIKQIMYIHSRFPDARFEELLKFTMKQYEK